MPHQRRVKKGSFGSHFDELVARFPASEERPAPPAHPPKRDPKLQERIDIHAQLFERAWQLERER
jgi:hypothetical protein